MKLFPTFSRFHPTVQDHSVLFTKGEGGYNTHRIPGLLVIPGGTILAFCEARKNSGSDWGHIDLAFKRSTDGGESWSPLKILWTHNKLAIQNPCPVYDTTTKKIILHLLVNRHEHWVMVSDDEGVTWCDPTRLELKKEGWVLYGPAPGHGIQLPSGRLLFPGMYNTNADTKKQDEWGSYYFYSDDHGQSWQLGHVFPPETNECICSEGAEGEVIMVLRPNRKLLQFRSSLKIAASRDGGETADKARVISEIESPICQVSVIKHRNLNILSCPNSLQKRINFTLFTSLDGGNNWDHKLRIFRGKTAYSDLAVIHQKLICGLFEGGARATHKNIFFFKYGL